MTAEQAEATCNAARAMAEVGDVESAEVLLRRAAQDGHPEAQFELGSLLLEAKRYQETMKWLKKAVDGQVADAALMLGSMHYMGEGIPIDRPMALIFWKKGYKLGLGACAHQIGIHFEGIYDEDAADQQLAAKWFRRALDLGEPLAACRLANMAVNGRGMNADPVEALKLYRIAATATQCACGYYGVAQLLRSGKGGEKDPQQAFFYMKHAAEHDYLAAYVELGHMYTVGAGIGRNDKEAAKWYRKAMEAGDDDGKFFYAAMIKENKVKERKKGEADKLFREAAEAGHQEAKWVVECGQLPWGRDD